MCGDLCVATLENGEEICLGMGRVLRALRSICSVRGVDFVTARSVILYLLWQSLYMNLKSCTWMVIEHNKIEKVRENL